MHQDILAHILFGTMKFIRISVTSVKGHKNKNGKGGII